MLVSCPAVDTIPLHRHLVGDLSRSKLMETVPVPGHPEPKNLERDSEALTNCRHSLAVDHEGGDEAGSHAQGSTALSM